MALSENQIEAVRAIRATMAAMENRLFDIAIKGDINSNIKGELQLRVGDMYSKLQEL